jgi:hypothetical protein
MRTDREFKKDAGALGPCENLEKRFAETCDIRFAALAIGRHSQNPPAWAIRACRNEWCKCEISIQSPSRGRKPFKEDPENLEKMANLLIEEKCKSAWEAAGMVGDHPSNQR